MTIAISVKVHDGLVLAADSASTITAPVGPAGEEGIVNVYNNANKVFNLKKGLPVGGMTWGSGSIGYASISTLIKDLRQRFDSDDRDWKIDLNNYTIEDVAKKVRKFLFEEKYQPQYQNASEKPSMGFLVAGYSSGQGLAEEWLVEIAEGISPEPKLERPQVEVGCLWYGQPEAIMRLFLGYGSGLPHVLQQMGVPPDQLGPAMQQIAAALAVPLVIAPMPIQDTIDLAQFLVQLAIMYSRFSPGAPTVGGPIESVAITKHEGFKWIKRKHYYEPHLNPH
jgi:hypothetical protein